jgi:hypothetical protein
MGPPTSRGHDTRCAIPVQGLDAESYEYDIRTRYAGRICSGIKPKKRGGNGTAILKRREASG